MCLTLNCAAVWAESTSHWLGPSAGRCGRGAAAAGDPTDYLKRTGRKVTVTLPGGDLVVEWRESDDHVLMTGPVEFEFAGRFVPSSTTTSLT